MTEQFNNQKSSGSLRIIRNKKVFDKLWNTTKQDCSYITQTNMNNDVSNNTFIWSVFFTNKPKTKKFIAIPITVNGKNLLNEATQVGF
jgi:hypothetical protein